MPDPLRPSGILASLMARPAETVTRSAQHLPQVSTAFQGPEGVNQGSSITQPPGVGSEAVYDSVVGAFVERAPMSTVTSPPLAMWDPCPDEAIHEALAQLGDEDHTVRAQAQSRLEWFLLICPKKMERILGSRTPSDDPEREGRVGSLPTGNIWEFWRKRLCQIRFNSQLAEAEAAIDAWASASSLDVPTRFAARVALLAALNAMGDAGDCVDEVQIGIIDSAKAWARRGDFKGVLGELDRLNRTLSSE